MKVVNLVTYIRYLLVRKTKNKFNIVFTICTTLHNAVLINNDVVSVVLLSKVHKLNLTTL